MHGTREARIVRTDEFSDLQTNFFLGSTLLGQQIGKRAHARFGIAQIMDRRRDDARVLDATVFPNFQLMNERAARSLGHANAPARTNFEIDGLARSLAECEPTKHRLATNAHIDELDGLRNIVQEGVSRRRTQARFRRSQSRRLRKLIPAQVNARNRAAE